MRNFIPLFCMLLVFPTASAPRNTPADSLSAVLQRTSGPQQRVGLLLNLTDLAQDPQDELKYARMLFDEAGDAGDGFALAASLGTLTNHFLSIPGGMDSLETYLAVARGLLAGTPSEGIPYYYGMVAKARLIQIADKEKAPALCDSYTAELERQKISENPYEKVSRLFMTGVITYKLMELTGKMDWTSGLPYWEEAWTNIQDFPILSRKNFAANTLICLIMAYSEQKNAPALLSVSNAYLAMLDEYYARKDVTERRPYINKDIPYLVCYQSLVNSPEIIGKTKAHEYYSRLFDFVRSGKSDAFMRDKTFFYDLSYMHYLAREDYPRALAYKDSLIGLIETGNTFTTLHSKHYTDRARILKQSGRYMDACKAYEQAMAVADSARTREYLDKVGELQVKYETDKLALENTRLLAHKRKMSLYLTVCMLAAATALALYFYISFRREKKLKKEILRQSLRAQESDRMKGEFLKLMCHEIRTPLNAVNGFAELMADDNLEPDEKAGFPKIIRENTRILTSMVETLLETSNQDNSPDSLATQVVDAAPICREVMRTLRETEGKPGIEYRMEIPEEQCMAETHPGYFKRVLELLLDNANKYTAQGTVTLGCMAEAGTVSFTVTDTGCGIPAGKREEVFERFVKLDTFSAGAGLGLYLARLISRRMGASIRIDEGYAGGARFVFTVPAAR